MNFASYAQPENKPRWSELTLRKRWLELRQTEPDFKSFIRKQRTCTHKGCEKRLSDNNITGLCMDHAK